MSAEGPHEGEQPGPEDVGNVAEEAAKLLGALSGWARTQGPDLGHAVSDLAGGAASALKDIDEHVATGAEECRYCPVCRAVHAVRETSPDVRRHLTVAAVSLSQAVSAFLATTLPDEARNPRASDDVEHIDLDGEWPEGE